MIKFKKIKEILQNFFWTIGKNVFITFLFLIFLTLIFSGFIFYKYSYLTEKKEPQIIEKPPYFKEALYQKILDEWQIRQKKFEEAEFKEYRNLFQTQITEGISPEITEELTPTP